jgi:hypothetical protein
VPDKQADSHHDKEDDECDRTFHHAFRLIAKATPPQVGKLEALFFFNVVVLRMHALNLEIGKATLFSEERIRCVAARSADRKGHGSRIYATARRRAMFLTLSVLSHTTPRGLPALCIAKTGMSGSCDYPSGKFCELQSAYRGFYDRAARSDHDPVRSFILYGARHRQLFVKYC